MMDFVSTMFAAICAFIIGVIVGIWLGAFGASGFFENCDALGKTRFGGKVYECRQIGVQK